MNTKKYIPLLLSLFLTLSLIHPPLKSAAAGSVQVSGVNVNVREGPGLSYNVIKKVNKGETFSFIKEEGDWVQIDIGSGKKAWIANWLVTKKESTTSVASNSKGSVTANSVRVRTGPGTNNSVLGSLNRGDTVDILKTEGTWYQVNTRLGKGWIAKDYVQANTETTSGGSVGTIHASSLNVRSTPSTQGKVLGSLKQGEKITVLSQQNGWLEITYKNQKAWISNDYVKLESTSTTGTSTSTSKTQSSSNATGIIGTVTATSLNVRNSGSLNGQVIGHVSKGDSFQILEEVNSWVKIQLKSGKFGWIAGWYLQKSMPSESTGANGSPKNSTLTIDQNGTNIRSGPDLSSKVIARANAGDKFPIVNIHKDWYEIKLSNGKSGYVAGWIVTVSSGVPQVEKLGSSSDIKNKKIMIDPGHGGRDNGATGAKGTLEKNLTLKTAQLLSAKLKARGAKVLLTRNNDQYLSLGSRVSMAHYQNVDAFISLHYDSIDNHTVRGMTSYYYHSNQKSLASNIHTATIKQTKIKDRGVRQGNYHVIRENKQPAALLELGYLSNPTEELMLTTSQYQEQVTNGIVQGIVTYFK
ncbi:SH3 domain-containing protein [Robertmurraya massiliosenegalensis]|uniref:SH3 domain-containing protein n=1 Tax=Robertmurraya TaxID=2837507 RepID=UPI0039A41A52